MPDPTPTDIRQALNAAVERLVNQLRASAAVAAESGVFGMARALCSVEHLNNHLAVRGIALGIYRALVVKEGSK